MGWGSRIHRPIGSGCNGRRFRARVVIAVNEIQIADPMTVPIILTPTYGRDLVYATDLYQRVYCAPTTPFQIRKTTNTNGALYSAPASGGLPPGPEDTWTLVSGTELGVADADATRHVFQTPSLFAGLAYVDLWTYVYQHSGSWVGPFTVIHELWGNFFRWNRVTNPSIGGIKPEQAHTATRDFSIHLLSRSRG